MVEYDGMGGARLSSPRAMRCRHVQPGALIVPLPKTGHYSMVPLADGLVGPELAATLRLAVAGRTEDRPLFPTHDAHWWGEKLARATEPLPVFGELAGTRAGNQWHLLRATWAVNCARRGATLWQLMAWGGWTQPQTVMRYVNIAHAAGMTGS